MTNVEIIDSSNSVRARARSLTHTANIYMRWKCIRHGMLLFHHPNEIYANHNMNKVKYATHWFAHSLSTASASCCRCCWPIQLCRRSARFGKSCQKLVQLLRPASHVCAYTDTHILPHWRKQTDHFVCAHKQSNTHSQMAYLLHMDDDRRIRCVAIVLCDRAHECCAE